MPEFMIAYHGGQQPNSKEQQMAHFAKWKTWIESLGDKVVNPGTPLPTSKIITANEIRNDHDPDAMKGFAVIRADNMDEAINIAKTDPFLETGGAIRLSQMMMME